MTTKQEALWLMRAGWVIVAGATGLATINASNGNWGGWAVDGAMFLVAAVCILIAGRVARS